MPLFERAIHTLSMFAQGERALRNGAPTAWHEPFNTSSDILAPLIGSAPPRASMQEELDRHCDLDWRPAFRRRQRLGAGDQGQSFLIQSLGARAAAEADRADRAVRHQLKGHKGGALASPH